MQNRQLKNSHRGMTLVELLVVLAIIGTLLAISIPMLKPMLETRKTNNAAQVLAEAFQQARTRAIYEGKSYGIQLIPYDTAPTTALQLRLQKENVVDSVNSLNERVIVVSGKIVPRSFSEDTGWESVESAKIKERFQPEAIVQFNRIGRSFTVAGVDESGTPDGNPSLKAPYDKLNLPEDPTNKDALEYRISAKPMSSWLPPVVMPQGTVVDLAFSGGETRNFAGNDKTSDDIPATCSEGDGMIVMFSPRGNVDCVYIKGERKNVNEMLYFCVGEWDRQVDVDGRSLADDGKSNLVAPATYWVTLHPKTGQVRIAENAPIQSESTDPKDRLHDARKFAREHFFNVGGN